MTALQEIVLTVCLLANPHVCKDVHIPISSEYGESLQLSFHCLRQGQIEGQKWIAANEAWRIARWHCPPMNRGRKA